MSPSQQASARRAQPAEERPSGGADVLLRRVVLVNGERAVALAGELAGHGIPAPVVDPSSLETVIAGLVVLEAGQLVPATPGLQTLRQRQAAVASICLADDEPPALQAMLSE